MVVSTVHKDCIFLNFKIKKFFVSAVIWCIFFSRQTRGLHCNFWKWPTLKFWLGLEYCKCKYVQYILVLHSIRATLLVRSWDHFYILFIFLDWERGCIQLNSLHAQLWRQPHGFEFRHCEKKSVEYLCTGNQGLLITLNVK